MTTISQTLANPRRPRFAPLRRDTKPESPIPENALTPENAAALQRAAITSLDPPLPLPEPRGRWTRRLFPGR